MWYGSGLVLGGSFFVLKQVSICNPSWPQLKTHLPPPPRCWDYRCALPCLASDKGLNAEKSILTLHQGQETVVSDRLWPAEGQQGQKRKTPLVLAFTSDLYFCETSKWPSNSASHEWVSDDCLKIACNTEISAQRKPQSSSLCAMALS